MFWKRLASCGSCFAMSPPLKTASMYIHMFCTCIHISMISLTVDSFTIHLRRGGQGHGVNQRMAPGFESSPF